MGNFIEEGRKDEKLSHKICVDDFYLGEHDVTQGEWQKNMGNNPLDTLKNSKISCKVYLQ